MPHDHSSAERALSHWWYVYDEGRFDAWPVCFTEDVHFTSRTDTRAHPHEDFIASDNKGAADVLAWQREHRLGSPYPLRHNAANFFVTAERDDELDFASYLFVTHIVNGKVATVSSGLVEGTLRRGGERGYRFRAVHVVLDTMESKPLAQYPDRIA